MLRRTLTRGARAAPMSLRCAARLSFAPLSRNLSNTSAALHETAGDGAKTPLNREERLVRMEHFARKFLKDGSGLPTPYLLLKEFGGARATAVKVLSRLEEEMKNTSSPAPALTPAMKGEEIPSRSTPPEVPKAAATITKTTATTAAREEATITTTTTAAATPAAREESKPAQDAKPTAAQAKQPVLSLWEKLHTIAYGKASSPPLPAAPSPSPASNSTSRVKAKPSKDILSDSSDDSESESDDESPVSSPDADGVKNPAQPLFRADLQPRHGLYLKFLPPSITESDLLNIFRGCGEIHRIQIVRPRNPTPKYIYAFVDFKSEEALKDALKKEVVIRGHKAVTQVANQPRDRIQKLEHSDGEDSKPRASVIVNAPALKNNNNSNSSSSLKQELVACDESFSRSTIAVENIPHASLPQIVEALSQYGEVVSSRAKQSHAGNITAFVEFKNEHEKDAALAASKVVYGGKLLKMTRVDAPLTTVVRLSNIPADAEGKLAGYYKSYGHVEKVDTRMEGVVDIYYSENELKNMARILDKLNALQMNKKKLRAIPAPVGYPKSVSSSPAGLKWIESQVELVTKNMNYALKKSAMYSQDLQELLKLQAQAPALASN